jgi:gluconolactonase
LGTGLGGGANAEGPVWWKEGGYLLFSSIGDSKRMKYTPGQGLSVAKEETNGANGLTRDLQGRLVACEGLTRRVTRQELDGSMTVIAHTFQGRRLNKPNDVVVKSDGCVYFTDPWNLAYAPDQTDLSFNGVYRVTPDLGTISLLIDTLFIPNGLAFSPDESVLYINVFCGGSGGIYIMDPNGKKLGRIVHGQPQTTNMAFGGDDWKTLYFTSRTTLNAVRVKIAGSPVPAVKKS